jgi:hypothetical protein
LFFDILLENNPPFTLLTINLLEDKNRKGPRSGEGLVLAGGKGFEPLSTDPESVVLPLDEPPPILPHNAAFFQRA